MDDAQRSELERLRAEVATLRARQSTGATEGPAGRRRWRAIAAALMIVVACLLAPLSVVAVWARDQVTDTDRYVRTVEPLARDPAIQQAVADRITARIFAYIDVQGLTTEAVDALAARGLPTRLAEPLRALTGPVAGGVRGFVRTEVGDVVASQAFADAWVQANRLAHAELVKAFTGQGAGTITVEDDTVSVNLAPLIGAVKRQLVASGFSLAARVPEVNASFVLFQSTHVTRVRGGLDLLTTLGTWLPAIVLVLLAFGVYAANDHRRALVGAAVGVAAGMLVLALALAMFRAAYLDAIPSQVLSHDAAAALYDTIVRFLRTGLRTVLVLALVAAAAAFLTGPSPTATRTRQGLVQALGWLRASAGLRTGPVGAWVHASKPVLRFGAVALAGLALVFWNRPSGRVVIVLTLLVLVGLALIELLGQAPRTGPALQHPDPSGRTPP